MAVSEREFNVQVLETKSQWESGLRRRLALTTDGLSLFVNPAFDSWLVKENWPSDAGDIVVDECGQTYWTELEVRPRDERVWKLLRRNPTTCEIERVLTFEGCGSIEPRKLWLSSEYLWIFDLRGNDSEEGGTINGRMLGLSRQTSQILHEVTIQNLIDLDFDQRGFFYTLVNDQGHKNLYRHSFPTPPVDGRECVDRKQWERPVRNTWGPEGKKDPLPNPLQWKAPTKLSVGRNGVLYLLDTELGRIIRFDPKSRKETLLGAPQENLLKGFKASVMEIDGRGVIFLASSSQAPKPEVPLDPAEPEKAAALHMFDEDGSYLGEAELPSSVTTIDGIGFDPSGGIYLATDQGLARFSLANNPVGLDGFFYSPTLDNGEDQSFWHRIALKGSIPSKSSVEVFYYTNDDQSLKAAYDGTLASGGSVEEQAAKLENLLSRNWIGPEIFTGSDFEESRLSGDKKSQTRQPVSPDLILDPNKGRFLWLRLRLVTFDHKTRPSVSSARIYYPRLSYLRYLPPVYREETVSAAFLERFLSLFETIFEGLDEQIDQLYRFFDPRLTPTGFLPWLASWVGLALDDDVPEDRVRRFIQRSPSLYNRKGTPEALIEFLEIYTGRPVFLTEHSRGLTPAVLGNPYFRLGKRTVLLGTGPKGMRVGDTTVVGYAAVRDRVGDPEEPFLSLARRFTVVIDMDPIEFQKREAILQRIITEQKPAHTSCTLQTLPRQVGVGNAVLGVSGTVTDTRPYRVGVTPLGSGSAVTKDPGTLRLERGAWIGSLKRL